MDLILVIIFVVLGIAFFILEIFFLPGVSIGGIVGTLFTGAGIWYAFAKLGTTAGWIVVAVSVVVLLLAVVYFIKGKPLDKMALDKELESDNPYDMTKVAVGDKGVTLSRLAPMGKVLVNGEEYEAKFREGFLDRGVEIEVVDIEGNVLVVGELRIDY
jgi:membrane-bound ClpP family serine protease